MIASVPVGAARAYQTYTYSIGGKALYSPDAYTAVKTIDAAAMGLTQKISNASDLVVDNEGNVYIADTDQNRVICLDRYYRVRFEISTFINDQGKLDTFHRPQGVFVTEDRYEGGEVKYAGRIFVCDTEASRVLTFTRSGEFDSVIEAPESELFGQDAIYWPVAIAVDRYDRLFVVSSETNEGIIVMTDKGEFTGFIGAQQSVTSVWAQIWKRFQTAEQRARNVTVISYPYNNIDINERGFIYVTIYASELVKQMESAIKNQSTSGLYAPCKLLNPAGDEIMRRNGFWPPAGEVDYINEYNKTYDGVSRITDVACGPEQTWTIVDSKRNKLYTYDYDGNLLFAFGDQGTQLGNLEDIRAVAYQEDTMLVLSGSNTNQRITVFNRTEYGDALLQALHHQNERLYDLAIEDWKEILMRNSNYDAAYIGIGQSLFRSGKYAEALKYYKSAYDVDNYSDAYKELRKEWMAKFFLLIPIAIGLLCFGIGRFLRYAAKVNKRASITAGKRTYKEEILFVFHLMFHPFDGYWDLKHEKRGSIRGALTMMGLAVIALFYRSVGRGYVMNPKGQYSTIFMQLLVVVVPVMLFAVANWCLTTLFEGEGSFKDIFIGIGYSLFPLVLTVIPTTLLSNFVTSAETDMMVTHGYTVPKNLVTTLGTIVGMAFIMFLAILFTSLVMDMVSFVRNIVTEVTYRI